MRKLKYAVPIVLLLGVSAVNAGGWGSRSEGGVSSVHSVSSTPDGAPVTVRGEIASRESSNHYVLSDETGSVLVSLNSTSVSRPLPAGTPVQVSGQVDQASGQPRIAAQSVTVLASNSMPSGSPDLNPPISGGNGYQHFES